MTSAHRLILLAGCLCAMAASPASAQTPPGQPEVKPARQCFYERNINGWNEVDDRTVILNVSVNDTYLLKLFGSCPEIRHTLVLGVRNRGSDWICTGDTFDLFVRDTTMTMPRQCAVESMTPITREEARALSSKKRKR
jgi:hypothetical protein